MRARIYVLAGTFTCLTVAFGLQACGETEATSPEAEDAGVDVAVPDVAAKEAAPAEQDSATCDLSADFSSQIPDASIADGATTTGICLQCAKTTCEGEVTACNQDCPCQELASDALQCFLGNIGKSQLEILQLCGGNFAGVPTDTQQIGFAMINCINSNCKDECATDTFFPPDAGPDAEPDPE